MPQRFYGNKDLATFEKFNRELVGEPNIDDCGIIDQFVILYRVSVYDTETNMYGESSAKYYNVGFRVNCMINYNEPEVIQDDFGADVNSSINMYFQRNNLSSGSLNFYPDCFYLG